MSADLELDRLIPPPRKAHAQISSPSRVVPPLAGDKPMNDSNVELAKVFRTPAHEGSALPNVWEADGEPRSRRDRP